MVRQVRPVSLTEGAELFCSERILIDQRGANHCGNESHRSEISRLRISNLLTSTIATWSAIRPPPLPCPLIFEDRMLLFLAAAHPRGTERSRSRASLAIATVLSSTRPEVPVRLRSVSVRPLVFPCKDKCHSLLFRVKHFVSSLGHPDLRNLTLVYNRKAFHAFLVPANTGSKLPIL
jgi:hypothetical protein